MPPLRRALQIARVVLTFRLDQPFLDALEQLQADHHRWRWLRRLNPLRLLPRPRSHPAKRLRQALETLGPVFIKFGQILSTRRDLLPLDYANELALLQDQVPPFPAAQAKATIETALGAPVDQLFHWFSVDPLAAASVAQVHAATLLDGAAVVVKVIRPDIEPVIRSDLELLRWIAAKLFALGGDFRRLRPVEIVADYERTLLRELDLGIEANNTAQLQRNFTGSEMLYVPRVHFDRCAPNVLTMERINGVPISDIATLHARGVDMRVLAERGVEIFFTQVFVDNFFHADMHPGNIFVDTTDPLLPRYQAIDCAIMGTLTNADQEYLARNLIAFFNQNYAEVVRLHLDSGWVPPSTDAAEFERVIRALCEPIFAKPLKDISFGLFLVSLFQTARQFDMVVQPQLVLLQKTLLNVEGLGRQLYPDLDLWQTAKPFMERWLRQRTGPANLLRGLLQGGPNALFDLPQWPARVNDGLRVLRHAQSEDRALLQELLAQNSKALLRQRRSRRMVAAALLIGAAFAWSRGEANIALGAACVGMLIILLA